MTKLSFLVVLLLLLAPYSYAETYKWKDSAGRMHYSDVPPTAGSYEFLNGKKPVSAPNATGADNPPAASVAPSVGLPEGKPRQSDNVNPIVQKAREADKKRKDAEAKEEDSKVKQENCANMKSNLETMQSGDGVYKTNENGEKVNLDKETIAKEVEKAKKFIEKNCQ